MTAEMGPEFVHLRVHSHYSLLSAPCRTKELVAAAKADGQTALALTDSGNLFGSVEFYKACKGKDLKPILGMATFIAGMSAKEPSGAENPTFDLTLLAQDEVGFANLRQLSTLGYLEGFHYRPRIDMDLLAKHGRGLIVLSGNHTGEIPRMILQGDMPGARRRAEQYAELCGRENFFLEAIDNGTDAARRTIEGLHEISAATGIRMVATNDVHYLKPEDWIAQEILMCIQSGQMLSDPNRRRLPSREHYLRSRVEMAARFKDHPDALVATVDIARRCEVKIDFGVYHLPVFQTGPEETPDAMFIRLCDEGARGRYGEVTPEIRQRLEYEKQIIQKLGFVSYFLIVADFIRYARDNDIPVGPGRGSAAGSIVAYALRITDVDPLRYNLIFERFLNAERISMPDIDIDFCGDRREEVIRYVRDKYGEPSVCQIVTFGTMASRGVLRDVGRVLEMPLAEVDMICKKIPQGPGASLAKALESDAELKAIRAQSEHNRRLFDLGLKLEGLARHTSIHAAGVVIADRPLMEYVPMCRSAADIVTQWQMGELEEVGLLKMDFLGLKTLTILQEGVRLVKETKGLDVDLDHLDLEDEETYRLMTRGDTLGVFQLESLGMRELLSRLKPDKFEDVIAVLALYRPGPLGSGMVDMFVRRKHGEETVVYPHELLQPILQETYGVIVYQEQVMRIANVLAGFTMNTADELRKAMGKKKPEVMAKFKDQFITGCEAAGFRAHFAKELFETIEFFAGYGFNKSHSTAYALLTYRTAWLKAHHPVEFLAANLTVESGNSDKVKEFIDEARRLGISIRPPDVNTSRRTFTVEGGEIRYGLGAIKGLGARAADLIVKERQRSGTFRSFHAFCERIDGSVVNKTAMEAMARAGAYDSLGIARKASFHGIDTAMRAGAAAREDRRKGQGSLFGQTYEEQSIQDMGSEWSEQERLTREKESLGFYLTGHPFERRGRFYARIAGADSTTIRKAEPGSEVRIAGMISGIRVMQIKSGRNAGQKMARFQIEDLHGSLPVTSFARVYQQVKELLVDDAIVFLKGKIDAAAEEVGLLLEELQPAQRVIDQEVHGIVIRLAESHADELIGRIKELVPQHPGNHRLFFETMDHGRPMRLRASSQWNLRIDDTLLDQLSDLVGAANLQFVRA